MPSFRNAAERRAWLLEQLADVEREAILEDMAAGRNGRIVVRAAGGSFRVDVGDAVLVNGSDPAEFAGALSEIIEALPLGSTFVVEAGKGGKALSGGVSADEGLAPDDAPAAAPRARGRKAQG